MPTAPVRHHVVQLPVYRDAGDAGKPDRTAAQSEIRALDGHRFLMLSRDGAGLGSESNVPVVYKRILLVDTHEATNLAGTVYETGTESVLQRRKDTALRPGIRPAAWTEMVDMLDPVELARVDLVPEQLSEKWEAMDLVSVLDPAAPEDYFLFVGNDNDFIARQCTMAGQRCDSPLDNDSRVLVYRLTLPGYSPGP